MTILTPGYEVSIHPQDAEVGRVGVVLDVLADASARAADYTHLDVAVAYASGEGVRLLDERLASETWSGAQKRFLVSIDFGFTEPRALSRLNDLPNAEVRVPNASSVLQSPSLKPRSAFHAKTFAFGGANWYELRSVVVGSSNLTASALSVGAEVVTKLVWDSPAAARDDLQRTKPHFDWFNEAWDRAEMLVDVLDAYRARRRALPKPRRRLPEERTAPVRRYVASLDGHVVNGTLAVQLAAARTLWISGESIIHNRGGLPGNQLNTRRGTRVFFGFGADDVSRNTTLGFVNIRVGDRSYIERSIRFGDNGMDIVGLPISEQNGLETYEGVILVFTRDGASEVNDNHYTLTVTDEEGLAALKAAAANSVELSMASGRPYGLLF